MSYRKFLPSKNTRDSARLIVGLFSGALLIVISLALFPKVILPFLILVLIIIMLWLCFAPTDEG